ncbi:iron chelate uptake ABC transporter family permease subunit [Psittacicella gerlachiana]|uniref:Iron ABC transporter permease n=1 Tax=Psittacicella gerlachiana TaxID=2028574 RepID=A0A3A1YLP3_9GAMM|nr:iron chelate uptake ABC transporter family permease subunit [Psittacicella gerlachiana]RIY37164.1 iron ABC transporter permease [Psittacicella gerlachiana]
MVKENEKLYLELVAERKRNVRRVYLLGILAIIAGLVFLFWGLPAFGGFIMKLRWQALVGIILTGAAIGVSSMVFQAIVQNRIITPSILGLDSLYVLIITGIIYISGSKTFASMNQLYLFVVSILVMLVFSYILFKFVLRKENHNIFFILLLGIVFGTFFSSLNTFMANLLDPGEFLVVQSISYASFQAINTKILGVAAIFLVVSILAILCYTRDLEVISLGRDVAINLGLDYHRIVWRLLFLVVICISISTALVGPITFLGLLVMNLTLQFIPTNKYKLLLPGCIFLSITVLVIGQTIVQRVFNFNSSVSIIINFIGGVYFILLLLKQQKKW